ncbi:universal stress protein [Streptomyces sp. GC420]|uniref:universal stress protein n=1 Tax=Streptomyces sp. GC420 TaxID=2697568 RepID=UPI001414CDCC|nr:universal stress protein [Streptomyces sp. GC420]NBM15739.1 universal stress protein [Streptomyces sp. GC420]
MPGPVVVGLDGSRESLAAARWAAREATARRSPLLLLHSWTSQPLNAPIAQEGHNKQLYGREVLDAAAAELTRLHPGLSVSTELVADPAAKALLDHAEDAGMLVVGSRGHGAVVGFLLGSVSLHVIGAAGCPVVTVRAGAAAGAHGAAPVPVPGDDDVLGNEDGAITVGLSAHGPAAHALLDFAFASAEPDGTPVRVVRSLPLTTLLPGPSGEPGRFEAQEREALAGELAAWREKFPTVPLTEHVETGTAAQVLLAAAAHSRLVVVGKRRHSAPFGGRLGPVAHAALHHLPCPVAVVPHD